MNHKSRSMKTTFVLAIVLPGIILTLIMAATLTFGLLLAFTGESIYQNLLLIVDAALIFVYITVSIFEVRYLHGVYQQGLYEVSRTNLKRLAHGDHNLLSYPDENITEMKEMNQVLNEVSLRWKTSVLYSANPDYSLIDIEYVDTEKHVVSFQYFRDHLPTLIHLSTSFTVGVLCLHYDLVREVLTDEEKEHLLFQAEKGFSFIPGRLFAFGTDGRSLYCYLPGLDSMRIVKERILEFAAECTVSKRAPGGMAFFPMKAALVCYPHSSIEDILADLRYARRQTSPITIFLPDRKQTAKGFSLNEHPDSVAFFNRIITPIRRLDGKNAAKEKETIQSVFNAVGSFIGSDFSDLVVLEQATNRYYSFVKDEKQDATIPTQLLDTLMSITDDDGSFYFSTRASCSSAIARMVDDFGVSSGILYSLTSGDRCIGAFYYGKKSGDLVLDSYMKEALLRLGEALTDYFLILEKEERALVFQSETEHILGLTNYMVYKVDDATMRLTYFSPNLRAYFPNATVGEPCHKALYGLDRMCPNCPMKEMKKMRQGTDVKVRGRVRNIELETSLTLNDRKVAHERTLLIKRLGEETMATDPYDRNWLVYSYHTLIQQLENAYLNHSRGYLLLLSFDNLERFVAMRGSEGACVIVRTLIETIKRETDAQDVYAYGPNSIAILLPRLGHVEMIDLCEAIYDLTKAHFLDGKNDQFTLTYLPLGYPRGFTSASEFLAHAEDFFHNGNYVRNRDFIYLPEHKISRSASKQIHMLEVIDEVFGTKAASCVYLQPMITADHKKLFGAEMLLRVEDTVRHNFFRADELSKVAVENGRTSLITESLLNFVGELYKEHGNSTFALNNFSRISINVDAAFLTDQELSKKVADLYAEHHLSKDFLAFEVPEDLIGAGFETQGNAYAGSGVVLVCDRYTGKYVPMDRLKRYGFREIKLPRELVTGIESDAKKLQNITEIVNHAKELGLRVSVVGVENSDQFIALRELDPHMLMQGYHFYKPLSRSELITAIVSHNQ